MNWYLDRQDSTEMSSHIELQPIKVQTEVINTDKVCV